MAGSLFFNGYVKEVVLACQYADKTGALCDMGALILAVLAKKHKVDIKPSELKQVSMLLQVSTLILPAKKPTKKIIRSQNLSLQMFSN
jgi:hypothetical protein